MDSLTILLTNIWLVNRGGSETVIRDLALGLLRRGHRPIVYSPSLGEVAEEIAARGVSVIDDLRKLGEAPDIIHAHHSIPCGEALLRFPHVPAIDVCHSFGHWAEAPVHFPQIGAYVAVDEACRDRLVQTEGIDPKHVVLLRNAVDLRRIPPRPRPAQSPPRRALAFGKAAAAPEPRIACARLGIEYQALGDAVGRVSDHAERELVHFDLVFASARAALEALCCGCAVLACDSRGIAGLVTSSNFDSLRARNFGLRCLSGPITVDRCVEEIARYDAAEAAVVAERAREQADLEKLLDEFEKLYAEILTGARRPRVDQEAHERAVARFLHENLPRRPADARWPWLAEREQMRSQIEALEATVTDRRAQIESLEEMASDRRGRIESLEAMVTNLRGRLADAERDQHAVDGARSQLADLKRSRLLAIGRLLRRVLGLPIPY